MFISSYHAVLSTYVYFNCKKLCPLSINWDKEGRETTMATWLTHENTTVTKVYRHLEITPCDTLNSCITTYQRNYFNSTTSTHYRHPKSPANVRPDTCCRWFYFVLLSMYYKAVEDNSHKIFHSSMKSNCM